MNAVAARPARSFSAGELFRHYATDPLRLAQIVCTAVVLGYGARQDNHSPLEVPFLENLVGASLTGIEVMMALILVLEIIRRLVSRDFTVTRSPLTRPLLAMAVVLGVVPYIRMMLNENGFRLPLELVETPGIIMGYFIWLFVYRREDVLLMLWLVLIAGLFKSIEGIAIFVTVGLGWGLLTGWRDAMLMAFTLLATFFAFAVKPQGDRVYQRIRLFMFGLLPLAMFTYIGSTRRSFVLGAGAAIIVLAFFFRGRELRRLMTVALPAVVIFGVVATFLIGSSQFVDRLGVIGDPRSEGSATYRLLEVYNITNMIAEKPLFGWAWGVPWQNGTLLEFEIVSPVIPHNSYLYAAWRGGLVGLAAWLWFLAAALRMHFRTLRAAETPRERFISLLLAGGTISAVVAGFTMNMGSDRLKWFFPFILAIATYLPGAWPQPKPKATRSTVDVQGAA